MPVTAADDDCRTSLAEELILAPESLAPRAQALICEVRVATLPSDEVVSPGTVELISNCRAMEATT